MGSMREAVLTAIFVKLFFGRFCNVKDYLTNKISYFQIPKLRPKITSYT